METTPIISPILSLLKSRKVILAITTAIINLLVMYIPALDPLKGDVQVIVSLMIGAVILGIAYEDGQGFKWSSRYIIESAEDFEPTLRESAQDASEVLLAEFKELSARLAEIEKKLPLKD